MTEASWPLEEMADILGGELRLVRDQVWKIVVASKPLGTSLALQLSPAYGAVQLEPQRDKRAGPWTIGCITFYGIASVTIYPGEGEVTFRTADTPPTELLVSSLGQFRLVKGIDAAKIKPLTRATGDEVVTVVGNLARPFFSAEKKTPYWQAGVAEQVNGADHPIWHNVKAWGSLARTASQFPKGQRVRVTGTRRLEKWEKDGQLHTGYSVLVTAIEPA